MFKKKLKSRNNKKDTVINTMPFNYHYLININ